MKKRNQYLKLFVNLALTCTVVLSVTFIFINSRNIRESERIFSQKQTYLLADDLNEQLKVFEGIALQIKIDSKYQLSSFSTKYYDRVVLADFKQYANYSVLADGCFLYYSGKDLVYHSSGYTNSLEVCLQDFPEEKKNVLEEFSRESERNVVVLDRNIIFLYPIDLDMSAEGIEAVLGFLVEKDTLLKRFQMVGTGMQGDFYLYRNDALLYSNCSPDPEIFAKRNLLSAMARNGEYIVCYLPQNNLLGNIGFFSPLYVMIFLLVVLLILVIAGVYARKSYRPLLRMAEKYRESSTVDEWEYRDALDELDSIMSHMLQSNLTATLQIQQSQQMLRTQFFQMLLNGRMFFDFQLYLDKLDIQLVGPYFYVTSVFFESETEPDVLTEAEMEILELSIEEKQFSFVLKDNEKKKLTIINNIREEAMKTGLTQGICEIVNHASYQATVGTGRLYKDMSSVSASWLESVDNVQRKLRQKSSERERIHSEIIIGLDAWQRFFAFLYNGERENAVEEFQLRISEMEQGEISMLVQQCIYTLFLGEFVKLAEKRQVNLGNRELALLVTAKSVQVFKETVLELIHEFCDTLDQQRSAHRKTVSDEIYQYVNDHFTEFDISIEKVASEFAVTTVEVRQSIVEHTGKMYKEYLMELRVKYAQKLLLEGVSVSDACHMAGYESLSYFVKLFKRIAGISPAKYRGKQL